MTDYVHTESRWPTRESVAKRFPALTELADRYGKRAELLSLPEARELLARAILEIEFAECGKR